MPELLLSTEFERWLDRLKDLRARIKIVTRLRSMSVGNFGDAKALGGHVLEMRIHYGPGYRLYYMRQGEEVYVLLIGGDKSSQQADIAQANSWLRNSERTKNDDLARVRCREIPR